MPLIYDSLVMKGDIIMSDLFWLNKVAAKQDQALFSAVSGRSTCG